MRICTGRTNSLGCPSETAAPPAQFQSGRLDLQAGTWAGLGSHASARRCHASAGPGKAQPKETLFSKKGILVKMIFEFGFEYKFEKRLADNFGTSI